MLNNGKDKKNNISIWVVNQFRHISQISGAIYILSSTKFQQNTIRATTQHSNIAALISSGFFLYDTIVCISQIDQEGPLYVFHAFASFLVFAYGYVAQLMHYYGAAFILWETSTPFIHLRWFMFKLGLEHSKVYDYNAWACFLSFFLCRIVWGYYTTYNLWIATGNELLNKSSNALSPLLILIFRVSTLLFDALNTYWFYLILIKIMMVANGTRAGSCTSDKDE